MNEKGPSARLEYGSAYVCACGLSHNGNLLQESHLEGATKENKKNNKQ